MAGAIRTTNHPDNQTREGKPWHKVEENYAVALMTAFGEGSLESLSQGTSLREFLAQELRCNGQRILEKFRGTGVNMNQAYIKESSLSPGEAFVKSRKLKKLRRAFELSVAAMELQSVVTREVEKQATKIVPTSTAGGTDDAIRKLINQQVLLEGKVQAALGLSDVSFDRSLTCGMGCKIPSCNSLVDMETEEKPANEDKSTSSDAVKTDLEANALLTGKDDMKARLASIISVTTEQRGHGSSLAASSPQGQEPASMGLARSTFGDALTLTAFNTSHYPRRVSIDAGHARRRASLNMQLQSESLMRMQQMQHLNAKKRFAEVVLSRYAGTVGQPYYKKARFV